MYLCVFQDFNANILVCASAFILNTSLFLFYHILNSFPREPGKYPIMHWAGGFATASCCLQFMAGILLLNT